MAEVLAKDRHALKRCFLLGCLPRLSAMDTYRNIRETIEEDYDLHDKSHSGRPLLDIDDDITDALEDEPRSSVREVSSHAGPSFATIFRHQKESGRTAKYGQVISHELTDSQLKLNCDLSQSLFSRKRSFDWILDIVTGNEKWGLYVYHTEVEILPHPSYSPNLAPTDYHLFRSLQNSFAGQKFDDRMQVKSDLDRFFSSQPPEFYAAGIAELPQCWQDVISTHGPYITY
ncbi:hypothetical protein CRE_23078 [Caenorhabditis remanei]|uniref:Tc1-like transposase DDE domain-containing protein n=1 Tax=Caenorhabditis remanei TaxID=31234 RepID=E3N9D3_CAERE|nr:hypothetical protein CRE_23078 [Caenorhabditis remanei]